MSTRFSALLPTIAVLGLATLPATAQYNPQGNYNSAPVNNYQGAQHQGHVTFVPAGMTIPVTLQTAISTDVAKVGDLVQGTLSEPINLGNGAIPAGSTVIGSITNAKSGGFLGRAGMLTVKFNRLRLPNGQDIPMSTHIVGGIGKYTQVANGSDTIAGETWKTKAGQTAARGLVGAGLGAALGTAVGAIAGTKNSYYGHSGAARGAGRGAWSGAAIGGGLGVANGLLMRKGKNVVITSGTPLQLQLDAPIQLSQNYVTGAF